MPSDADDIRERAHVDHRRPPRDPTGDRKWFAEDPVTECAAVGEVELEAVGNLVAVVQSFEESTETEPLLKIPGDTMPRVSTMTEPSDSLLDRFLSLF